MLSGWGTKIPVMLQCAGLMHYRGYFDGRCLMLINDNDNLKYLVFESPTGEGCQGTGTCHGLRRWINPRSTPVKRCS